MSRIFVVSVPRAGRAIFGIGPYASYQAANRGEIETIHMGRRKLVSVRWIEETLGLAPGSLTEADFAEDEGQPNQEVAA